MPLIESKAAQDLVKTGVKALAKYIIKQYKKAKTRTTVGILFKTKKGKWEVQYVDMVLTPEMQQNIDAKLLAVADHELDQATANKIIARKFQVRHKDKPAFNTNLTLAEWTPAKNLAFSSGQIIPMTEVTKTKLVSTEGYDIDYSKAYICAAPVAKTFEKLTRKGVKDPLAVLNKNLKYDPNNQFETSKQFKQTTKKNLKFLKSTSKKYKIIIADEVKAAEAAAKQLDDLDLDLDFSAVQTAPEIVVTVNQDDLDLELEISDNYISENKMGMNAGQIYDDIDLDLEGEPVKDAKPIQQKHKK